MRDLMHMSEVIETEALRSLFENCSPKAAAALGLKIVELDDVTLFAAQNDPSIVLNRAIGLGTHQPVTAEAIAEIAETFKFLGVDKYFLHLHMNDVPTAAQSALARSRLVQARGWMKFHRPPTPVHSATTDLKVRRIGPQHAVAFGRIVAEAFDLTEAAVPALAGLVDDPHWYLYVSFDGDEPAGAGGLYVRDGVGWLDWGATRPEFRRRGSQSAIMTERLSQAEALGCDHIFTATGEAVEGDPQHSYSNILKRGFSELKLRENFKPGG